MNQNQLIAEFNATRMLLCSIGAILVPGIVTKIVLIILALWFFLVSFAAFKDFKH